jgi:hypothetical protein
MLKKAYLISMALLASVNFVLQTPFRIYLSAPLQCREPVNRLSRRRLVEVMEQPVPPSLPDDLIAEILARVPYKSLCCFKCVSRPWPACPLLRPRRPLQVPADHVRLLLLTACAPMVVATAATSLTCRVVARPSSTPRFLSCRLHTGAASSTTAAMASSCADGGMRTFLSTSFATLRRRSGSICRLGLDPPSTQGLFG